MLCLPRVLDDDHQCGVVAQLAEHGVRNAGVGSSNLLHSTTRSLDEPLYRHRMVLTESDKFGILLALA